MDRAQASCMTRARESSEAAGGLAEIPLKPRGRAIDGIQ